jgi:type II secretory pathway pseudopilin PulG
VIRNRSSSLQVEGMWPALQVPSPIMGNAALQGLRRRRSARSSAGFTTLELLVTAAVMLVALLTFAQTIASSRTLTELNRETTLATEAARRMIETVQAQDFEDIFALYNSSKADDPGSAGSAPGPDFAVGVLEPEAEDDDGLAGEILFPSSVPGQLNENAIDESLGMPRDLNGDTLVDALDHSGDYLLLPVVVRVQWKGAGRPRILEFRTLLAAP